LEEQLKEAKQAREPSQLQQTQVEKAPQGAQTAPDVRRHSPHSSPTLKSLIRSAAAGVRKPLPWEWPPEQVGQPPFPKWRDWPDTNFQKLRAFCEQAMKDFPHQQYELKGRKLSAPMRKWLAEPKNTEPLRELGFRLVLLIACTEPSERRTLEQKKALAKLALDSAIALMTLELPSCAEEIKERFDEYEVNFSLLALDLVIACEPRS
jgi:hypothetical protein